MMIDTEERDFLNEVAKKIDQSIDKEFEKNGLDRAYFNFKLVVSVLGEGFSKLSELTLIDDSEGFCNFCHEKTFYYDNNRHIHVCAACLLKLEGDKK